MTRYPLAILIVVAIVASAAFYLFSTPAVDVEAAHRFQQAQEAFDRATTPDEFTRAASMYQSILDRGVVSGAVLYNQGNAWMRAEQPGRAIAAYHQAVRYRPDDTHLRANLDYALTQCGATAAPKPFGRHLLFWQDWLGYSQKFRLTGAVLAFALLLSLAAVWSRSALLSRSALAAGLLALLLAVSTGYDWWQFDHQQHGVIVADEVIARKGNAMSYEPAFTEPLADGTEFTVADRRGDWLLVRLPGDQEGWIQDKTAVVF
ncbi:MAG: hypothetical protein JW818_12345 [Pirellulales bacterium]|nr:hypothetical protein [Pirellulales bacterium]